MWPALCTGFKPFNVRYQIERVSHRRRSPPSDALCRRDCAAPDAVQFRAPVFSIAAGAIQCRVPFLPDAWAPKAGGFPIMTLPLGFLMKDVLFLAASFYLLKQNLARVALQTTRN